MGAVNWARPTRRSQLGVGTSRRESSGRKTSGRENLMKIRYTTYLEYY